MPTLSQNITLAGRTLATRLASEKQVWARRFAIGTGYGRALLPGADSKPLGLGRFTESDLREMRYAGTIYLPHFYGGALGDVLRRLGRGHLGEKSPITPHYNPVRQIVDFDCNAFGGRLGTDITIADEVNERPVTPALLPLIRKVWRWSNLDETARELTNGVANHGTVGIRIILDREAGRVFLDFDDRRFFWREPDVDPRGNVITAYLRYNEVRYVDAAPVVVQVEEVVSKYGFSRKVNGQESLTPDEQENPLGICPYVLCRRSVQANTAFGPWAYQGIETAVDGINFALSQLDEATLAAVWPTIFSTSAAQAPSKITVGRTTLLHSQTRDGQPKSTFEMAVPPIDVAGCVDFAKSRVDWIREQQPQLALTSLSLLSGVSGETLQQVLKPAEAECLRARVAYEDAVRRALQIAISIGIANSLPGFDLGTGTGTADAAERAYDDGDGPEAFEFADRDALPATVAQQVQRAQAEQADAQAKLSTATKQKNIGLPQAEQWRTAGYPDSVHAKLNDELAEQGTLPGEKANEHQSL